MSGSSQKFIARNRAPRVQIEYDVELYGSEKKVQLPFVMGVMSDLSGKSRLAQPSVEDRSFLEIDVDNFDSRMKAMQPRAAFSVPNTLTGEGNLSVDLTFEKMDDFSPAAIASKVDALRPLLEARTQLSDLMAYMDGKAGAEALIEKILSDTGLLTALSGAAGHDGDQSAALASLRALAPPTPDPVDESANILEAMRQAAPEDSVAPDAQGAALASLASVQIAEAEPDTTDSTLADMARAAPEDVDVADDVGDALGSLAAVEIEEDKLDSTDDLLADMAAEAPDDVAETDDISAALDGLADLDLPEDEDDSTDDLLADMAAEAPDDVAETDDISAALDGLADLDLPEDEDDTTDDLLADMAADAPEDIAETDDISAALDGLADLDLPEDEDDSTDDLLADMAADAPDDIAETDDISAALDGLADLDLPEDEVGSTDDLLADMAAEAPDDVAETDDISAALDGLADLDLPEDEDDSTDDLLADMAAEAPDDVAETDDISAALDGLADLDLPEDEVDTTDDLLADMAAEAPDDVAETDNLSAALDGLADLELPEDEDDTTDDLLADMAADAPDDIAETDDVSAALDGLADLDLPEDEVDTTDDLLADMAADVPDEVAETDDISAALDGLADLDLPEDEDDSTDDLLADMAAEAPDDVAETDDISAALDGLADLDLPEDEVDSTDDLLADMAAEAPDEVAEIDDLSAALDGLADLDLPEDEDDSTDDLLADMAAEAPDDIAETDDISAALDGLADLDLPEDEVDTTGDLLADMAADAPDDVAETDDVSAALDGLADLELPEDEVDSTDDLLTELTTDELDDGDEVDDIQVGDAEADDLDDLMAGLEDNVPADDVASESQDDLMVELEEDDPADESGLGDLDDLMAGLEEDEPADDAEDTSDLDGLDDLMAGLEDEGSDDDQGGDDLDGLLETLGEEDVTDQPLDTSGATMAEPEFAYGQMSADRPAPERLNRRRFRIALLGDFSGRAARGLLETGDDLAQRAPILLDPDTVEDIIEDFATDLVLPIGKDGAGVAVKLGGLDDLHPDELYENVDLFAELVGLRGQLSSGATAEHAARTLRAWGEKHGTTVAPTRAKSAGNTVPANLKLSDFQKLIGDTKAELTQASPIEDLLARVVGPYIRAVPDADALAMQGAVDKALSAAMRLVLHHPEFQSIEAQWRSLDLIARSIETDDTLDVVLYDISAEEIAADLATADDLTSSGFARLLTEEPLDEENGRGGYSALIGLYTFEETPPHAELLGRIARVAAHVDAPFFTAITPTFLDTELQDRHPLVAKAWDTLRAMPEAKHLGLVSPRFLLRRPYGAKSEPIYEFEFEEFTMSAGLGGMLWANPVVLVAILLAKSFRENGASMGLGSIMQLGDMPFHFVTDSYGDQVALPCTERNLTLDKVEKAVIRGYMSVVSVKGRDEVRLASFQSLGGVEILGPWSGIAPPEPSPPKPTVAAPGTDGDENDNLDLDDLLSDFADDGGGGDTDLNDDDLDADLAALLGDL